MPRQSLTEPEIAEFRRRAVDVAERLFAEHGIDGVTMRALASALGCSAMTPYRYFDNQEHLIAEVRTQAFRRFARHQADAIRSATAPLERIRRIRRSYVAFATEEPNVYLLMFSLPPPKTPRPELEVAAADSFSHLRLAVKEAVDTGRLTGDPVTLAHLIWAELHGLVMLHTTNKLNLGRSLAELAESSLLDPVIGHHAT